MKPSTTTGTRAAAAPSTTPARPAISKPPTFASTSTASDGSGRFTSSPRRTTSTLRRNVASSMPVPRPVTSSGGAPVNTAASALDAVVLPMPMSPMPIIPTPSRASASARTAPVDSAASACSRVIAGPRVKLAVPGPIRRTRISGRAVRRMRDAHVDDDETRARLPREHVDRRAATREVEQHLPGDFLRVGADALGRDAVVGAHHDDRLRRRALPAATRRRESPRAGRPDPPAGPGCGAAWSWRRAAAARRRPRRRRSA